MWKTWNTYNHIWFVNITGVISWPLRDWWVEISCWKMTSSVFSFILGWAASLLSRLLCGHSTSWQCNIFIGCKLHGRISATVAKPMPLCSVNHKLLGSNGRVSWGLIPTQGGMFLTCLCPLRHTRLVRNYPLSVLAERATPIPHSLSFSHTSYILTILEVYYFSAHLLNSLRWCIIFFGFRICCRTLTGLTIFRV